MNPANKYSIALAVTLTLYASPSFAIGKRDITVTTAENGVQLSLSKGYGVVINLGTVGQSVATAWLSDPSQVTLASNKGPCNGQECAGAAVLYLKPINRLNFPGLPSASDGASLLSVLTNAGKVFQFKLNVTNSAPAYTNISIIPPLPTIVSRQALSKPIIPSRPTLPLPRPRKVEPTIKINLPDEPPKLELKSNKSLVAADGPSEDPTLPTPKAELKSNQDPVEPKEDNVSPKPELKSNQDPVEPKEENASPNPIFIASVEPNVQPAVATIKTNQDTALALLRGLHSPQGKREVGRNSIHYRRTQSLIIALKRDENLSLDEAIANVRLKPSVAHALIRYGAK